MIHCRCTQMHHCVSYAYIFRALWRRWRFIQTRYLLADSCVHQFSSWFMIMSMQTLGNLEPGSCQGNHNGSTKRCSDLQGSIHFSLIAESFTIKFCRLHWIDGNFVTNALRRTPCRQCLNSLYHRTSWSYPSSSSSSHIIKNCTSAVWRPTAAFCGDKIKVLSH